MRIPLRLLMVEDSESDALLLLRCLSRGGYDVIHQRVENAEDMRAALNNQEWNLVTSDHAMPRFSAPAALAVFRGSGLDLPFIIVSAEISQSLAVELMKGGAQDYIRKDDMERLVPAIERELREADGRRERRRLEAERQALEDRYRELFAHSHSGVAVYRGIEDGRDFVLVDTNLAGERIGQIKREDVLGRRLTEIFPGIEASGLLAVFRRVWRTGQSEQRPRSLYQDPRISFWHENYIYRLPSGEIVDVFEDVSERKQAEEALFKSEERYNELVQRIPVGIYIIRLSADTSLRLEYGSPQFCKILGLDIQTLMQEPNAPFALIHPEDREQLVRANREAAATITPFRGESRFIIHGETRWIRIESDPVKLPDGESLWNGVITDITERKQREEALRESEHHFRSIIENTEAGYFFIDKDGIIRDANDAWIRMYHYDNAGEILGKHFTVIQKIEDTKAAEEFVAGIMAGDERFLTGEFSRRCRDKSIGYHNFSARPVQRGGEVIGIEGFVIDITERKLSEQALRESENYFRRTFEQAAVGMSILTPEGTWLQVNQRLCDILGYSRDELMKLNYKSISYPDCVKEDVNRVQQMVDGVRSSDSWEKRYIRKDGCLIWVRLTTSLFLSEDGQPKYFISVTEDITEKKQAEEEILKLNNELEARVIERTAQLASTNSELEAFTYSVSHDLRAPLRQINGYSQILLEDYADRLDEEGKHRLASIRDTGDRMSQIIDALLSLSRLTTGELKRAPVDISSLAHAIATELRQAEPDRTGEFKIAPELVGKADPDLVGVVLRNLLSNAWKFTAKESCPFIEVNANTSAEGKTVYWVRDNGAGFDMAYADKLFGAFQRLHTIDEFPGVGIGLATVKRIVRRHNGHIWAEGAENKGATFYFTLE